MEMSLINTLYAIRNTLGEISVSGDKNVSNMTACFRALDGCIDALNKHAAEQQKAAEEAARKAAGEPQSEKAAKSA